MAPIRDAAGLDLKSFSKALSGKILMSLKEQFNILGKYYLCSCQELDKKICNYKETIPHKAQLVLFPL